MEYHHGDILLLKKIITMMIIATTVLTPTKITKITIIGLFSIVTKYLVCIEMILKVNFLIKGKKLFVKTNILLLQNNSSLGLLEKLKEKEYEEGVHVKI